MYKVSELIKITNEDGSVEYAIPNHRPMKNWTDFTVVDTSEVDFDVPLAVVTEGTKGRRCKDAS